MKGIHLLLIGIALLIIIVCIRLSGVMNTEVRQAHIDTGTSTSTISIMSFEDCEKAAYSVMESYPRQCKTPDGRTFAEDIIERGTYVNTAQSDITVENPFPGAAVGYDFSVVGQARGNWFFEGSFPIEVQSASGTVLAQVAALAQTDWMTENVVPFKADIHIPVSYTGKAMVIIKKDNPSGLPQNDASYSFPITIEY